jgi:quercetin dioxygenase-like cupin family protein
MKCVHVTLLFGTLLSLSSVGISTPKADASKPQSALVLENLHKSALKGTTGTEVIVSRVTIPPNITMPRHWHPGEEFAYILKGSVVLWKKGKPDVLGKEGEVVKVPFKQIHTAITNEEGATILVFRVHEQGKPERVRVD